MALDLLDHIIICGNDNRASRNLARHLGWEELAEIERASVVGFWRTLRARGLTDLEWSICSRQTVHTYVKRDDGMCGCGQVPARLLTPLTCDCGGSRKAPPVHQGRCRAVAWARERNALGGGVPGGGAGAGEGQGAGGRGP